MTEGIDKEIGIPAAVKTETHFFAVGLEMFGTEPMPRTDNAALEQRKGRFHGVRVNVAINVGTPAMLDDFMIFDSCLLGSDRICGGIIGKKYVYIFADILANELCQRSSLSILCMKEPQVAISFADAHYHPFVIDASDTSLATINAANVGSVQFHFPIQHWLVSLRHCVTNAMAEIPRGFIGTDSKSALNLTSRHTLLRFTKKLCRRKPSNQRQMRIMKYGSNCNAKLIIALIAPKQFRAKTHKLGTFAARTLWTVRPAQPFQEFAAPIITWKALGNLKQIHRRPSDE